ncbi:MAG: diacylglycerol kinase family lipid kinase [Clostridia bacterium]|nr:diacylglycerol kinase family lipid kinase [Clostridia bacterium]
MRYVFIINPVSGKGAAQKKILPKIEEYFKDKDLDYTVYVTSFQREGVALARKEAEKGDKVRIFACGGDGTTFDVLNGIAGHDNAELCVIPGGSGNDLLKYFGDASAFTDIDELIKAESYPIDLIKVGDWYAVNVCSMGLDAEICLAKDRYLKWKFVSGEMAYKIACIHCFLNKTKNHFKITADDGSVTEGDFLFAIGANGSYYGGGFHAAPPANISDGILDYITIKTVSKFRFIKLLGVYRRGGHIGLDICTHKRVRKMTVECKKDATVNMDGEIITARKIDFEIVPGALKFVVPNVYKDKMTPSKQEATV